MINFKTKLFRIWIWTTNKHVQSPVITDVNILYLHDELYLDCKKNQRKRLSGYCVPLTVARALFCMVQEQLLVLQVKRCCWSSLKDSWFEIFKNHETRSFRALLVSGFTGSDVLVPWLLSSREDHVSRRASWKKHTKVTGAHIFFEI